MNGPGYAILNRVDSWRCGHCGEVIGLYEPAVVMEGEIQRPTGRLAEQQLDAPDGDRYHRVCAMRMEPRLQAGRGGQP